MPAITRTEILDPHTLSEPAIEGWIDRLYEVQREIFDGVSRESFARYVVRSPADQTQLQISYGPDDEVAGYIAVHAFRRQFRGSPCTVLRAEAGLRRAFRGGGSQGSFFASHLLRTRLASAGEVVYLGCLVHPSSYTALARDAAAIWPSPEATPPDDVLEFMMALGEEFHLEQLDPARPLVRDVGWITRDTPSERLYWQECDNPYARFYIEQNPGFVHGNGLLTLIPLDSGNLGRSLWSWGRGRVQKSLRRAAGALERTVLRPSPAEAQVEGLLEHLEEATGLDLDALRGMRGVGTRYPVAARTVLFRAGDAGDTMYFVLSGALQVLDLRPDGDEIVIDQLGPGMMVGEMALVTGRPRGATVRAAADSVLVRLDRDALDALFAAVPGLEDQLWRYVGRRIFDERTRAVPGLAEQTPMARKALADAAPQRALAADEVLTLEADAVLVLMTGQVVCDGPAGWASLSSPAALTLSAGARVRATAPARLLLVPSPAAGAP